MNNALRSPADDRDWVFENLVHGHTEYYNKLPEEFTWEEYDSPSRHQGNRGTCGPFAAAKITEINKRRLTPVSASVSTSPINWTYLSPEFIYFHRANKPSTGMFGRDVFRILRKYGTVPEEQYPYAITDNNTTTPDVKLYDVAKEFKIKNYAKVKTIDGLRRAIIELGPCMIELPMYNNSERFWDKQCGFDFDKGHAVCVIGYNRDGFIIKNSWGDSWGQEGKSIFLYSDFDLHWEIWAPIVET